jgi:hypothetical protein
MVMKPERDIAKLPKWAQQDIAILEKDLAYYKSQVEKLGGTADDATITWEDGLMMGVHPLPDYSTITFKGEDGQRSNDIRVSRDGDAIRVSGDMRISVHPSASNVVNVRTW